MKKIIFKGRPILEGISQGKALVSNEQIVWSHGVDPWKGTIDDKKVKINGESIRNKIFVYPFGKGSTSSSTWILEAIRCANNPCAIVNKETELIITTGFLYGLLLYNKKIPVVDSLEESFFNIIATGDLVKVDGYQGIVEIFKK